MQESFAAKDAFVVNWRRSAGEVRTALVAGAFDACLFFDGADELTARTEIATIREAAPALPVVVLSSTGLSADSQAHLLEAGADSVCLLSAGLAGTTGVLQRLGRRAMRPAADPGEVSRFRREETGPAFQAPTLELLRGFSRVLGDSLDTRSLARHFVDKLREVVGASRIALFLDCVDHDSPLPGGKPAAPRLECVASAGLPSDLVECFSLSRQSGMGLRLSSRPEILRAERDSAASDPHIAREFEVLGGNVAIPVGDRDRILGVAVLGGRITGGGYSDQELLLVYHLLEELGLAVKNSRLHRQIVAGHELVGQMLEGLTVGAAAIGPDQRVIYANRALRNLLPGSPGADFTIHDLPAPLAARIHEVVEKGAEAPPFFHETTGAEPRCLRASVVPLAGAKSAARTALLLLEDFTPVRAAQKAELEAAGLRLTSLIARRFAHEIRNALVPLTTHAQLFDAEIGDAGFRASLKGSLDTETRRILRFTEQMLLLARTDAGPTETLVLAEVLRDAFDKALAGLGKTGALEISGAAQSARVAGCRAALIHAFQEIFFNGLQSSGEQGRRVFVSLEEAPDSGSRSVLVRVRDTGAGFAPEVAPRATEAFFTTRNTGVGLGLTIARRVVEAHSGALEVRSRRDPADCDLLICLPLAP